jgi:hypothetical protein
LPAFVVIFGVDSAHRLGTTTQTAPLAATRPTSALINCHRNRHDGRTHLDSDLENKQTGMLAATATNRPWWTINAFQFASDLLAAENGKRQKIAYRLRFVETHPGRRKKQQQLQQLQLSNSNQANDGER